MKAIAHALKLRDDGLFTRRCSVEVDLKALRGLYIGFIYIGFLRELTASTGRRVYKQL